MGTQQVLLIVLSIILVAVAVAVGIQMFNEQARNSNRQSILSDLHNYAPLALAYYKSASSVGGGGNLTFVGAGNYLGFQNNSFSNENGDYQITTETDENLVIYAIGNEAGRDSDYENENDDTGQIEIKLEVFAPSVQEEFNIDILN
jgi:hypothetical protein